MAVYVQQKKRGYEEMWRTLLDTPGFTPLTLTFPRHSGLFDMYIICDTDHGRGILFCFYVKNTEKQPKEVH